MFSGAAGCSPLHVVLLAVYRVCLGGLLNACCPKCCFLLSARKSRAGANAQNPGAQSATSGPAASLPTLRALALCFCRVAADVRVQRHPRSPSPAAGFGSLTVLPSSWVFCDAVCFSNEALGGSVGTAEVTSPENLSGNGNRLCALRCRDAVVGTCPALGRTLRSALAAAGRGPRSSGEHQVSPARSSSWNRWVKVLPHGEHAGWREVLRAEPSPELSLWRTAAVYHPGGSFW